MNKTLLFFRTTNDQIVYHKLDHYINIDLIYDYYDHSHANYGTHIQIPASDPAVYYDDIICKVTSEVYTAEELKVKLSGVTGSWISATLCHQVGAVLQPDREIEILGQDPIDFVFSLNVTKDELKKQVQHDISMLEEGKAHSLNMKDTPTQDEQDFMDDFMTNRATILTQYETDKTTLGLS